MFDELSKYKNNDHFFFSAEQDLENVCNAPTDKNGVFYVIALIHGRIELVYISHCGELDSDGKMSNRTEGLGSLKDEIVNGHQFGNKPRKISWPNRVKKEGMDAIDVYWYVTHDKKNNDCPKTVAQNLLEAHAVLHGELPRWNREE